MPNRAEFNPNWASMPGDTIADILSQKNLSLSDFSKMMGSSLSEAKMLLNGFISINEPIARKLEHSLGGSTQFWLRREELYRLSVERLKESEGAKWLNELPVKNMQKKGWIHSDGNLLEKCLDYFKVPDVWTWRKKYSDITTLGSFRKSTKLKSKPASLATWIRQGEIQAESIESTEWNPTKFQSRLQEIKTLTRQKDPRSFILKLRGICAECGVIVAVVPTPEGCTASGAAKFLPNNRGLIILSFRYRTDDHLWFTFFHEAGHLLLHGDKEVFVDEEMHYLEHDREEREANEFALETLLPGNLKDELQQMRVSEITIRSLANKAGVSLGIIVGQLQFSKKIPMNYYNPYKRKYDIERVFASIN